VRLPWERPCAAHRDALVDFATRRCAGPDVRRALDHVDRCRRCEADLAATTLVVHALRRLHAEASRAEPAADGWARLRLRLVTPPRRPSLLMSGIPGLLVAIGLCSALAGPGALLGDPVSVYDDGARVAPRTPAAIVFEQASDQRPPLSTPDLPTFRTAAGTALADDVARSVVALRSVPAALPGPDVQDGGSQPAPAGADRR
jgi:hypothetical protein